MVKTDASDGVVAGILSQQHFNTEWYSVAYFLKTMAPAECNYCRRYVYRRNQRRCSVVRS